MAGLLKLEDQPDSRLIYSGGKRDRSDDNALCRNGASHREAYLLKLIIIVRADRRAMRSSSSASLIESGAELFFVELFLLSYFFAAPSTESLAALAIRNLTTVLAGILISSPVAGLRPVRALRCCLTSLPSPGSVISPFFLTSR